ncbi:MAG: Nif3-like dinuclear metal center hexameric protein [Chitinophagaceae bacterium]
MKIAEIISCLEDIAHPSLQEDYDNAGLITGNSNQECTGAIISLDATEAVVQEAIDKNFNLVIAHHPIVFRGLKKINGKNYIEKTIIKAIKHDIAIYAIHTNLDNIQTGVNGMIAEKLGLTNCQILAPKKDTLKKLCVFVPEAQAAQVRNAIFEAGAGHIGNYSECSFNTNGTGTFKPGEGTTPFVGEKGLQQKEPEIKIETVFPSWLERAVITAMKAAHPYEEVAFDIYSMDIPHQQTGAGMVGKLPKPVDETSFLQLVSKIFEVPVIRHTALLGKPIEKVAVCGGAGSFLISNAISAGAAIYITADMKYHEFFDANGRLVIADIGHYESEQFTIGLLHRFLQEKFPTFAALKTGVKTNPVNYFLL